MSIYLKKLSLHSNFETLLIATRGAGFRVFIDLTEVVSCLADHIHSLHPLNGPSEECSAGVAAVSTKVEMIRSWSSAHSTLATQGCRSPSLLTLILHPPLLLSAINVGTTHAGFISRLCNFEFPKL